MNSTYYNGLPCIIFIPLLQVPRSIFMDINSHAVQTFFCTCTKCDLLSDWQSMIGQASRMTCQGMPSTSAPKCRHQGVALNLRGRCTLNPLRTYILNLDSTHFCETLATSSTSSKKSGLLASYRLRDRISKIMRAPELRRA